MTKPTIAAAAFALVAFGSTSAAQGPSTDTSLSLEAMLALGKGTGACGILNLQLDFQRTTKMPGGEDFIVRFWTTEAARLGKTLDQYAEQCVKTVAGYERLAEIAAGVDKERRR